METKILLENGTNELEVLEFIAASIDPTSRPAATSRNSL